MRAVADTDSEPLERGQDLRDGDTSIVWDTTIGGFPVCLLGIESHPAAARLRAPAARHETGSVPRHTRAAPEYGIGQGFVAGPFDGARQAASFLQPVAIAARCIPRLRIRQAETFEVDERGNALGARTGIQAGNIAAHAVPDQMDPAGTKSRDKARQ